DLAFDVAADLAGSVVTGLAARGLTLATAEASVGGMIGHLVTNVPGASRCFIGGIAPYARAPKTDLLRVDDDMLTAEGSVSAAAALAMARGARDLMHTDVAVAETGVASDTGNPLRPAGMYFVAIVAPGFERTMRCQFAGTREENKRQASEAALRLILDYLDETTPPTA
ncbi:MAG: CinA family protein, partial [Chloroflexota bacterium]